MISLHLAQSDALLFPSPAHADVAGLLEVFLLLPWQLVALTACMTISQRSHSMAQHDALLNMVLHFMLML